MAQTMLDVKRTANRAPSKLGRLEYECQRYSQTLTTVLRNKRRQRPTTAIVFVACAWNRQQVVSNVGVGQMEKQSVRQRVQR